ncbi:hypothetical protein D3C76_1154280 [compost metagenome]
MMQQSGRLVFRFLMQPVVLSGGENRVSLALVFPDTKAQVVLQKLTIASIKTAVEQRFAFADALLQLWRQLCTPSQRLL